MARVISALVLLPVVVGAIWFLPPWGTLVLALAVLALAALEFSTLAAQRGAGFEPALAVVAAATACVALAVPGVPVETALLATLVVVGSISVGAASPEDDVVRRAAVPLMAALYIGLPIGALVAVRTRFGPQALLLVMFTVMASDVAQYYAGRAFGRHLLAPVVSPKKTVEGAAGGVVGGTAALVGFGALWVPAVTWGWLAALGIVLVLLGIVGDLFESLLKRSAGVKDASGLIPGHGGMLDRVDSLLFVAPVYYVVMEYLLAQP
jgi:phosphatidate cytidylyltransferase